MGRKALFLVVILAAAAASAVSATARRDLAQTNDFIVLFPIEVGAVLLGGGAAAALAGRPDRAPGALAAGLYLLVVGAGIGVAFPIWLPEDDAILGSALLGGALAGVGAALTLMGVARLAGRGRGVRLALGGAGGALALLAVAAGGMVAPLSRLQLPIVVAALAALGAAPTAWRERRRLARPLALAAIGALATTAALIARGPGDWAAASTSAKLYSAPIVVIAGAVSLLIMDAARPTGRARPGPTQRQ